MINFYFENDFAYGDTDIAAEKINRIIKEEGRTTGELSIIFCDDDYLLKINQDFLKHDYYTDVITFNGNVNDEIGGDIYISTERVLDNSHTHKVDFANELYRVMFHGVLHLCGYNDKTDEEQQQMRLKEDYYLNLLA